MTFFHFINCIALSCTPYYITYRFAGLYKIFFFYLFASFIHFRLFLLFTRAEYSVFWKYLQTGFLYLFVQFCKMLILATFFPAFDDSKFDVFVVSNLVLHFLAIKNKDLNDYVMF